MRRPKAVFWICVVLVAVGMARIVFYEGWVTRHFSRGPGIDSRYAQLKPLLPPHDRFGFLTDERFARALDSERYTQALYGLAPRTLILDSPDADLWVADLIDPASLARLATERGLEPTVVLDEGRLVLLRRKSKQ
jgi:hypothetical protein